MSFGHLKLLHFSKLLMLMPWDCSASSWTGRPVSLQRKLLKPDLRGVSPSTGRRDLKYVVVLPLSLYSSSFLFLSSLFRQFPAPFWQMQHQKLV